MKVIIYLQHEYNVSYVVLFTELRIYFNFLTCDQFTKLSDDYTIIS